MKPYNQMTEAERIARRIELNREMDQRVAARRARIDRTKRRTNNRRIVTATEALDAALRLNEGEPLPPELKEAILALARED